MLLLHALVIGSIVAATLLLLARATLAHVAAADYATPYEGHWIGARSDLAAPYMWIGPLVIGRHAFPGSEVYCDRFAGENGPARTVGFVFAGVEVNTDLADRTARRIMAAPYVLMSLWVLAGLRHLDPELSTLAQVLVILGIVAILAHFGASLVEKDRLRTDLHYATRGADGEAHEAYARGVHAGIGFETQRRRFMEGERYDNPTYPANPYAA